MYAIVILLTEQAKSSDVNILAKPKSPEHEKISNYRVHGTIEV